MKQFNLLVGGGSNSNFRLDIAGLRAISVLAVVIFHIFPKSLVGGYLGVDVFFVISGYLISGVLFKEHQATGKINLLNFYNRRILRIMPATSVMIILTLLASFFILFFDDLAKTSMSAMFSSFGFGNIYFYQFLQEGYWAKSSELYPFLHLWSLGVEEQFYFFLPLFVLLFAKNKKSMVVYLFLAFALSFLLAEWLPYYNDKKAPKFNHYMIFSRAFELAIGVFAQLYKNRLDDLPTKTKDILSGLSIAIIVFSFTYFNEKFKLPNGLSFVVLLPTMFLLMIGHNYTGIAQKVLGNPLFKMLGLYSFSIYIWHWTILSLEKNFFGLNLNFIESFGVFGLSIIAGAISYYVVEEKFRHRKWSFAKSFSYFVLLPFVFSMAIFGYASYMGDKYPSPSVKFDNKYVVGFYHSIADYGKDANVNNEEEPNVLLTGSSFVGNNYELVKRVATKLNFGFKVIGTADLNATWYDEPSANSIKKTLDDERSDLIKTKKYDVIIICNSKTLSDVKTSKLINKYSNYTKLLLIVGLTPHMDNLHLNAIYNPIKLFNFNKNLVDGKQNIRVAKYNNFVKEEVKKYPNARYIDFNDLLLDKEKGEYKYTDGKESLYYNFNHLSVYGAKWLASEYMKKDKLDDVWYEIARLYKEVPSED